MELPLKALCQKNKGRGLSEANRKEACSLAIISSNEIAN